MSFSSVCAYPKVLSYSIELTTKSEKNRNSYTPSISSILPKGCVVNDTRISRKRRLQIVIPHGDRMKKDFALIKRIIKKNFPDFEVHSATKLGEGWMSEVFEINNEWAFRFAKNQKGSQDLEKEIRFLPHLQATISFQHTRI